MKKRSEGSAQQREPKEEEQEGEKGTRELRRGGCEGIA